MAIIRFEKIFVNPERKAKRDEVLEIYVNDKLHQITPCQGMIENTDITIKEA
jgi:hypothetical protein